MWRTTGRWGSALLAASITPACGKTHHDDRASSAAQAGAGGGVGVGVGAGGSSGSGSGSGSGAGGVAGAPPTRCQLPLAERCSELEAGPPSVLLLRPDEYANSVLTLFGAEVDVEALIGKESYEQYATEVPPEIVASASPAYAAAAKLAAAAVAERAAQLLPCAEPACVEKFVADLAPKVWRSAVSAGDQATLVAVFQDAPGDSAAKLEALAQSLLGSSRFYARSQLGDASQSGLRALSGDELAAKLSYQLWADTPDETLLALARSGDLTRAATLEEQARRLLADPRAAAGLSHFYGRWLRTEGLPTRMPDDFMGWSPELGPAMTGETAAFLNSIIVAGDAKIDSVFGADYSFIPSELASIYGIEQPEPGFPRMVLPSERKGLLTQPSILTATSFGARVSAAARGRWVRERLRCEYVPDPVDHVRVDPSSIDYTKPPREQAYWLSQQPCALCHLGIDLVGFGFANFDALGRYRTTDTYGAIDPAGELRKFGGEVLLDFNGAPALGDFLARDPETFACVAQQFLQGNGRPNPCSAAQAAFASCQTGDLRELIAAAVATDPFRFVDAGPHLSPTALTEHQCDAGGLSDCASLAKYAGVSLEECEKCQGAACGTPGCNPAFPCRGSIIIRGCCGDDECSGLANFCGKAMAPHRLCVMDDAF